MAAQAGANRIELCAGKSGGITPSYGTIKSVCQNSSIPVHVLIRPREGNFYYSETEFQIMQSDIENCREWGVAGVVFGILNAERNVDAERCKILVELAKPMQSVFHKAVDATADIVKAFQSIIDCGFLCILSSGGKKDVLAGLQVLENLTDKFNTQIQILPGGGIRSYNLAEIHSRLRLPWYHSSALAIQHNDNNNSMFSDNAIVNCDATEIRMMQNILLKSLQ
ncbi:MAG: copper homeostasis protein CutC [Chitinophagales bacterium]